jgi:hypothetical protein
MLLSICQFLISFTYYIDKHNVSKQLSTNLKHYITYDQFKFVSDPSSNIREVTR